MFRVIVLDNIAQEGLTLLDEAEGIEYEVRTGLKGDALRTGARGVRRCGLSQRCEDHRRVA